MRPSLFAFAGGEPAFAALAAAHHTRCLADPELNHPFSGPGLHPHHVERLAAYWAEVLGGPPRFSGECGDHSAVLLMHAHNGDMGDLGDRAPRLPPDHQHDLPLGGGQRVVGERRPAHAPERAADGAEGGQQGVDERVRGGHGPSVYLLNRFNL